MSYDFESWQPDILNIQLGRSIVMAILSLIVIIASCIFGYQFAKLPEYISHPQIKKQSARRALNIICRIIAAFGFGSTLWLFIQMLESLNDLVVLVMIHLPGFIFTAGIMILFCFLAALLRKQVEELEQTFNRKYVPSEAAEFWIKLYRARTALNITKKQLAEVSKIDEYKIAEIELNHIQASEDEKQTLNNALETIKKNRLPKSDAQAAQKWRCPDCGNMIDHEPCPHCNAPKTVQNSFCNQLYNARTAAKIDKSKLAEKLGVSIENITAWENGDSVPNAAMQEVILSTIKELQDK